MRVKRYISVSLMIGILTIILFVSSGSAYAGLQQATPQSTDDSIAGTVRTDAKGIKQVWVPAGCFTMGADDAEAMLKQLNAPSWTRESLGYEDPAREVCLTAGYWIDQFEVTNKAFQAFVDDGGYTNLDYWSAKGKIWLAGQKPDQLPVKCTVSEPDQP